MLDDIKVENLLFLDIETVPQWPDYDQMDEDYKKLWDKKAALISKENESTKDCYKKAGIYSEFGKIICISVGYITNMQGERGFRVKSFYGHDEKELLAEFSDMLSRVKSYNKLCAHNGKEFDFPYISRRILINGLKLPDLLDIAGKKPWEVNHIDTMELWKFGDYKNYTSLELLAKVFNIPTPKDDIDGSQVASVYYEENDLERIVKYCEKDVLTVAQLILKYKGEDLISENNIEYIR
ncbi:MAG: 3'-5' exonuclease [Marinilabiliales bacterium]